MLCPLEAVVAFCVQTHFLVISCPSAADKNFDVSFSSTFFVLSRFRVFFSDGSSETLQKRFTKKIVSKSFYEKFDQKSKTDFFSTFFLSRFWAFLDEGSSKTR
jgi:hypothetical protein